MYDEIETELRAHLSTLPNSPPVVWPNQEATQLCPYLEVAFFYSRPERYTINGHHRFSGIMQVTYCGLAGDGTKVLNSAARLVADHFPEDLKLDVGGTQVRITERPAIATGLPDESMWRIPVSIYFEAYN